MNLISDISIWWLLPWLIVCLLAAWFVYRRIAWLEDRSKGWRYLLISLRTLSLTLLGILLIGILFEAVSYRTEKPVFINLVDNSSSMRNYSDSSRIREDISDFRRQLQERYGERFEVIDYSIGSVFRQSDSLDFEEQRSALADAFTSIRELYYNRNIGGISFFSDGNYNEGVNPVYTAEKIQLTPVFTIGTGDTTPKRDQLIRNVTANEIAFYRNKFPVQVDLEALKIGQANVQVSIEHNGKRVASEQVNYQNDSYEFKQVSFLLDADQVGYQRYSVVLSRLDNEYNYDNNRRDFYVEILDSRNKVLLLAGAPSPDIAAVKGVADLDENIEVQSKLVDEWDRSLENTDLVIWHEPGIRFSAEINNLILKSGVPVLYFVGPNTPYRVIQQLDIGLRGATRDQADEVQVVFNSTFREFEISDELKSALRSYPPVRSRFGNVSLSPGNTVFLNQQVGGITKQEPLIYFGSHGDTRYGVIYGTGIWRWKLSEYAHSSDSKGFTELIRKINQYLVVKQNTSNLRISLPRRFTSDEDVSVKAEFYNEALEPVTTPDIDFVLTDEQGKVFRNRFARAGNYYKLSLGTLRSGRYTWHAETKFNGKSYEKNGVFVVEDLRLEDLSTHASHGILKAIATGSGGKFYTLGQTAQLLDEIGKREDIASVAYKESTFNDLIDYKWLLFLLVLLLTAEWFIRRWLGAY